MPNTCFFCPPLCSLPLGRLALAEQFDLTPSSKAKVLVLVTKKGAAQ